MEYVCPICNGLSSYIVKCQQCGSQMDNVGAIHDFYDDYSPYLPIPIAQRIDNVGSTECVHLFYCKKCNYDKRIAIPMIYF